MNKAIGLTLILLAGIASPVLGQSCPCPLGAVFEGEPVCQSGYIDVTNAGCNGGGEVTSLECDDTGVVVCGTSGVYDSSRDTDWYSIVLTETANVTIRVISEQTMQFFIAPAGCPLAGTFCTGTATGCVEESCTALGLQPGEYYVFVGADPTGGAPCGSEYTLTIEGFDCPPVAVEEVPWSQIKTLYE